MTITIANQLLPVEILIQIFDLATDEDIIVQLGIPISMAESVWSKDPFLGEWRLRSPNEAMNLLQRRSYGTKKAIISTCKQWHAVGYDMLFRCLYFSDPEKLLSLCAILKSPLSEARSPGYGWLTRRLHISAFHPLRTRNLMAEDLQNALVTIIQHCPNLEIFIIERPMGSSFGPVVDALTTSAFRKLHTVHWTVPGDSISKVIWAFNSLPQIIAAFVDIYSSVGSNQEGANLGSATDMQVKLHKLEQLSLRGYVEGLVEQAAGWVLPSLRSFSLDYSTTTDDSPDVLEFLRDHGLNLIYLDINGVSVQDIATILDRSPNLQTFAFNADWRVTPYSQISNRPHSNIRTIGLHGLSHAFGVGYAAEVAEIDPLRSMAFRQANDLNMASLNKTSFLKLSRIRALSRGVLNDLNRSNGPSIEKGGYARWTKWWNTCTANGIRLEDCTGQPLCTLPQYDEYDDETESSDEEAEEEEDEEEDENGSASNDSGSESGNGELQIDFPPPPEGSGRTMELTRLLQEVRAMNEGRDEELLARIRMPRPDSPLEY